MGSQTKDTPHVQLRWALEGDEAALSFLDHTGNVPQLAPDKWSAMLRAEHVFTFVGEVHGDVVAYIVAKLTPGIVRLLRMNVLPSYRRRGVGRDLLNFRTWSNDRRVLCDVLDSDLDAQLFLRACQFRAVNTFKGREGRRRRTWIRFIRQPMRRTR